MYNVYRMIDKQNYLKKFDVFQNASMNYFSIISKDTTSMQYDEGQILYLVVHNKLINNYYAHTFIYFKPKLMLYYLALCDIEKINGVLYYNKTMNKLFLVLIYQF